MPKDKKSAIAKVKRYELSTYNFITFKEIRYFCTKLLNDSNEETYFILFLVIGIRYGFPCMR